MFVSCGSKDVWTLEGNEYWQQSIIGYCYDSTISDGTNIESANNLAAEGVGDPETDPELSPDCLNALKAAGQSVAAINRAKNATSTLQSAVKDTLIPWQFLAAIGVYETGFNNVHQACEKGISWGDPGCQGDGVFQIDLGQNPNITAANAENLTFAASFAANGLNSNMNYLSTHFPAFTPDQLLQATAASHNLGVGGISGNPATIDVGTMPNGNYGATVLGIMNCFK